MASCLRAVVLATLLLVATAVLPQAHLSGAQMMVPYIRGSGINGTYLWMLSRKQREDGLMFLGAGTRLRAVMARMMAGMPVHVTTLGGSNTAGDVQMDGLSWPQYLFNYLADTYGKHVTGNNGAVGGTRSNYMAVCHNMAVPRNADLIILEYALNDGNIQDRHHEMRRVQERLVRKLLNYPHKPAVLLAHILPWDARPADPPRIPWWEGGESGYNELALYYHLPSVSIRACCYQELLAGVPGFNTSHRKINPERNKGLSFYLDSAHVDGLTGARVVAELVAHALDTSAASLKTWPFEGNPAAALMAANAKPDAAPPDAPGEEDTEIAAPLPPPLWPGNNEISSERCFIGPAFKSAVTTTESFTWINEAKGARPRWGMVAKTPGALLQLKFNSMAVGKGDASVVALLAYLKSYHHMGQAEVSCVSGCSCAPVLLQGHTKEKHSQQELLKFMVSQSAECVVQVKVLPDTESGEHKVKLTGLVVSEGTGDDKAITLEDHRGAVENVGAVAARSHAGVFDTKNVDP